MTRDRARELAAEALRPNTRRAYDGARARYLAWCDGAGLEDLEPGTVASYIAARHDQGRSAATLAQDLAAVRRHWRAAGAELVMDELARLAITGARRSAARQNPPEPAEPLRLDTLRELARELGRDHERHGTILAARDRAAILIGWFGALRRSELAALDVEDIADDPRGLIITLRRTKTSDTASSRALPAGAGYADPVQAWRSYLAHRTAAPGPAFVRAATGGQHYNRPLDPQMRALGGRAIDRILRAALERAGIDPTPYSAHSLRAGLAVELSAAGAPLAAIMEHGGWRSAQVATGYARRGRLWLDSPLQALAGRF